ncbi:MAG: hypothetical protein ACOYKZ_03380 [Chlamydiia bacterium]
MYNFDEVWKSGWKTAGAAGCAASSLVMGPLAAVLFAKKALTLSYALSTGLAASIGFGALLAPVALGIYCSSAIKAKLANAI